jgi:hypothetical protein
MKSFLLALLVLCLFVSSALANPPDINKTSPDGKWLFKAQWYGDRGYTLELQNTKTGKTYFAEPHPADNEGLPHELGVLWSLDNHYLAINCYYGRIVFGVDVIALLSNQPTDHVDWPRTKEASMIKPEDVKNWDANGATNCTATSWDKDDVLNFDISMRAGLQDKATGAKTQIDSERSISIQFTGLKGKVIDEQPPQY